ncbi:MAG: glycosyl hydrolase family 18 protein [Phycisphaerales bacterium]|nr:glycosyl hydrolase family 18 protein [Phycisphaerales bacterium]
MKIFYSLFLSVIFFGVSCKNAKEVVHPSQYSASKVGSTATTPIIYSWNAAWFNYESFPVSNAMPMLGECFGVIGGQLGGTITIDYSASNNFAISGSPECTKWKNFQSLGKQVMLTIGGGTDQFDREILINGSGADQTNFANLLVNEVQNHGFNGIDLNIEAWWSYSKAQNITFANNLIGFVQYLRGKLGSNYKIIVSGSMMGAGTIATLGIDENGTGTMIPFLASPLAQQAIDYYCIESYQTGNNSFYDNYTQDTSLMNNFLRTGFPASKLLIGIQSQDNDNAPFYSAGEISNFCSLAHSLGFGGAAYWCTNYSSTLYSPYYLSAVAQGFGLTW